MGFTMRESLLLLLMMMLMMMLTVDGAAPVKKQDAMKSADERGTRLRGLWKLHMRDDRLRGKGSSSGPHPIREEVKQQLLYCRAGIGYHLQILPGGAVGGVHKPTENCWLKLFAVKRGVVGIRAVSSGLYLCMNGEGLAHGVEQFSDDCLWKENLEENHYTTYSSLSRPGLYLALSHKGELRRGGSVGRHQSCTHFLPRRTP